MSLEQINDELRLLDKEHKVSIIINFYHSVKFFMDAKNVETCSMFLHDDDMFGEPFDEREAFLIEYATAKGTTKKDFNQAMDDVDLTRIKVGYIAPCFQIQDFLKTVKVMVINKEQSLDTFMENLFYQVIPKFTWLKN